MGSTLDGQSKQYVPELGKDRVEQGTTLDGAQVETV